MKADVTHFTTKEGGEWHPWITCPDNKPSNYQLLCWPGKKRHMLWSRDGVSVRFHALKLSDGAEWDSYNGFRKPEWNRSH